MGLAECDSNPSMFRKKWGAPVRKARENNTGITTVREDAHTKFGIEFSLTGEGSGSSWRCGGQCSVQCSLYFSCITVSRGFIPCSFTVVVELRASPRLTNPPPL